MFTMMGHLGCRSLCSSLSWAIFLCKTKEFNSSKDHVHYFHWSNISLDTLFRAILTALVPVWQIGRAKPQFWHRHLVLYSRLRDSEWDVPYLFCNYPNRRRTSCSIRKLLDPAEVGLYQYLARTFHVTLSPRIYKGGQGSLQNIHHLWQYKQPHKT